MQKLEEEAAQLKVEAAARRKEKESDAWGGIAGWEEDSDEE
jgi:hypothetical protein